MNWTHCSWETQSIGFRILTKRTQRPAAAAPTASASGVPRQQSGAAQLLRRREGEVGGGGLSNTACLVRQVRLRLRARKGASEGWEAIGVPLTRTTAKNNGGRRRWEKRTVTLQRCGLGNYKIDIDKDGSSFTKNFQAVFLKNEVTTRLEKKEKKKIQTQKTLVDITGEKLIRAFGELWERSRGPENRLPALRDGLRRRQSLRRPARVTQRHTTDCKLIYKNIIYFNSSLVTDNIQGVMGSGLEARLLNTTGGGETAAAATAAHLESEEREERRKEVVESVSSTLHAQEQASPHYR